MDRMFDFEAQLAEAMLCAKQFLSGGDPLRGEVIGCDDFETEDGFHFIVDTCWVNDIKVYETAVKELNMDWVVVERFKSAETAKMSHFAWVQKIKNDGVRFFKSEQDGCIYGVMKED